MEELKKILKDEVMRCMTEATKYEPTDVNHTALVDKADKLFSMLEDVINDEFIEQQAQSFRAEAPAVEPIVAPPLVEVPKDEPAPIEMPSGDDIPFEQLRAEVKEAQDKHGLKVGPIMRRFIPEGQQSRLSNIPVEKRAEFLSELRKAVANAG